MKRWGRIDILHNNVGVSISGGDAELLEITEANFDRCVAINLKSCILACKHVIPIMREQKSGAIVNISSMAVITTYPYVAYKATKAAMVSFTEQLAYQNAEYGIRANVILPGLMNTPMAVDTPARSTRPAPRSKPSVIQRCRCDARWAPAGTSPTLRCSWRRTKPASSPASPSPSTAAPR